MSEASICIFGEVLFDCFPDGREVLGGAPFNVAWHLNAFGELPRFISAVGDDPEGRRIRDGMSGWSMDTSALQTDPAHATGQVTVSLAAGEPSYEIVADRAYDHIRLDDEAGACGLLYHGTLALRSAASAATLSALKSHGPRTLFVDVNLRDPWWSREQTLALLDDADWVKLNRDELALLDESGDQTRGDLADRAEGFRERHGLTGLVVTLGSEGALALAGGSPPARVAPTPALEVVDAVGAGDAFASVLILGIVRDWPLATTLERAQAFASRIVGQRGATAADPGLYAPFIDQWGLAN